MRPLTVLIALTFLVTSAAATPVVGVYLMEREGAVPPERIPFDKITHLFHAFVVPDAEGRLAPNARIPNRRLTAAARARGTRVILSVGGGGVETFPRFAGDARKTEAFVDSVVKMVREHGYHGVDLDWEHPKNETDRDNWARMMALIRERLDAAGRASGERHELTAAIGIGDWTGKYIDRETVLRHVDFLNIMTYDMCGRWGGEAGNHSSLRAQPDLPKTLSVEWGMKYWSQTRKIPKSKLCVGAPFYAYRMRGYALGETIRPGAAGQRVDAIGWTTFHSVVRDDTWTREPDRLGGALWRRGDAKDFIVFNEPADLRARAEWARAEGYRGVFAWELNHTAMPDGSFPLLDALATFREPEANSTK